MCTQNKTQHIQNYRSVLTITEHAQTKSGNNFSGVVIPFPREGGGTTGAAGEK